MAEGNGHDKSKVGDAAFVIRIAGQAGPRAIDVTFGVPLDMTVNDIHHYVDKVCLVIDRQTFKGALLDKQHTLEGAEKVVLTNRENKQDFINRAEKSWKDRGRNGPWQPTGSEQAQLDGWEKNIVLHTETTIPKCKAEIAELQRMIALEA